MTAPDIVVELMTASQYRLLIMIKALLVTPWLSRYLGFAQLFNCLLDQGISSPLTSSKCVRMVPRIRGSQNFCKCSVIAATALSCGWWEKNLPIWLAM